MSWAKASVCATSVGNSAPSSSWERSCRTGELFDMLHEAHVLEDRWRRHYNAQRPHRALGYRPPTPDTSSPQPVYRPVAQRVA
ncbi:MAG TPA: integrase core domain-containing protein [Nitrospiraceae bacterium]|nr:integrase core domain-containing protein [Nitrospiraceae bacterium]